MYKNRVDVQICVGLYIRHMDVCVHEPMFLDQGSELMVLPHALIPTG